MKLSEVPKHKLTSRLKLLHFLARGRAGTDRFNIGVKFEGHFGHFQSYEFSKSDSGGLRAMARLWELVNWQHFPIVKKLIPVLVNGKSKITPHYFLDCDPHTLDWDEILKEGRGYVWKRKSIEYKIEKRETEFLAYCNILEVAAGRPTAEEAEQQIIEIIGFVLETMEREELDKYEKFIKKYNPDKIVEVKA